MVDRRKTGVAGDPGLPRRSPSVSLVEMSDGEGALYDAHTRQIYAVNSTALDVWAMCDGTRGLEAMERELRDLYQLRDAPNMRRDIEQTIREFRNWGLLADKMGS